jgi:uncharacterized protein (TIGR00255 family)
MTGFGAARRTVRGVRVEVEVRAVNHRFLQVRHRLPPELGALEPVVEGLVRRRIARGVVTIRIAVERTSRRPTGLDRDAARAWLRELRGLARELGLGGELDLAQLLPLPGVIAPPTGLDPAAAAPLVAAVVERALDQLDRMRRREGRTLVQDLGRRHRRIGSLLDRMARRAPIACRHAGARLRARLEELLRGQEARADGDALARELALLADRADVTEEITRCASHLEQWAAIVGAGGEVGKRLEFLLQEIGREVNTVGAKSQDVAMAHLVVSLKAELEKQREQVQNLE